MRKRLLSTLLALCMVLTLLPGRARAADGPVVTSNAHSQNYAREASPVKSHLFENESGGLTRVEYIPASGYYTMQDNKLVFVKTSEERLVVEDYSSDFEFQRSHTIPTELSIWGGFYAGEDYNFFIFGQKNSDSDDSAEVIRVVKYSKDWQRLGQASLRGANTKIPFDGGSLRCAEYNGELYIRTCHIMYNGHQANMAICVRESDMTVLDYFADTNLNYVSHSFNQFVIVDQQQRIVTWDHGDTYPRSALLMAYKTQAGNGKFSGPVTKVTVQGFPGAAGDNTTGASLGGLAETASGYVMVHNYDGTGASTSGTTRVVCFSYVSKDNLSGPRQAISDAGTMTPVLAPTGLDGGYVLWNTCDEKGYGTDTLYYKPYASDGSVGEARTATAVLSDCQPIFYNGSVVWYTTSNSMPVFYALDENGVTASKALAVPPTGSTPEPGYGLMASPSVLDFGTVRPGGIQPRSMDITIANTGVESVRLAAAAPENYEISLFHSEMISAGESTILSVWPKYELPVGNYDATLTIFTADGKASASVSLKYTVTDDVSISASPATVDFGTVKEGGAQPAAKTVTVTNNSKVSVTLKTPMAPNYTIGSLSSTTLSAGQTATFTVQPRPGLAEGSYDSTLTISTTDNKASAGVSLKYTVGKEEKEEPSKAAFTDVPDWCSAAVTWAVGEGITNGTGGGKFSPSDTCKNTEILTMLWRAAGKPPAKSASPFTVASYYQDAVDWAYGEGLINSSAVPNGHCTRASALKYIWQALGKESAAGGGFTDVPANADYAAAVSWGVANGITNGYGATFRPGNTCTRAEIVTFLHRAYIPAARLTV